MENESTESKTPIVKGQTQSQYLARLLYYTMREIEHKHNVALANLQAQIDELKVAQAERTQDEEKLIAEIRSDKGENAKVTKRK